MRGEELFHQAGCAGYHIPELTTHHTTLPFSFPEEPTDLWSNVFFVETCFLPLPGGEGT